MRFKCINDYPGNFNKIGDIINGIEGSKANHIAIKYPNIFCLMNWWEEMELMDMPEYVKLAHNGFKNMKEGQVFWVKRKGQFEKDTKEQLIPICIFFCYLYGHHIRFNYNNFEPASKIEYEKYYKD